MFGRSVRPFRLLGFQVQADMSWLILAFLITWSLATDYFPSQYVHLTPAQYWAMEFLVAMGLFASLIFHELSHSLMARRFGISMKSITLFIFGGVAQMEDEPPSPKSEFVMAIAGPVSSVLSCAAVRRNVGWAIHWLAGTCEWNARILGVHHHPLGDVQPGPGVSVGWRVSLSFRIMGMDG